MLSQNRKVPFRHGCVPRSRESGGAKKREIGGSAWESNPPTTLFAPHQGFEVLGDHQAPVHSRLVANA